MKRKGIGEMKKSEGAQSLKVNNWFKSIAFSSESMSLKNVRLSRFCYFMAYSFELILYSLRGHFMPLGTGYFGISGSVFVTVAYGLASLIVMLLWTPKFKPLVRISVLVTAIGFVPFAFMPAGNLRLIFAIIAYIGLGGCVTSARCGYAFAVNNVERLVGIVIMYFANTFIRYIDTDTTNALLWTKILPLVVMAAMCVCLLMFKENDFEVKESSDEKDTKGLYWAFAYFIGYFVIDGYLWGNLDSDNRAEYRFLLAGLLISGVLLYVGLKTLKLNVWHIWNLCFVFSVTTGLFTAFGKSSASFNTMHLFSGLSVIGWPLCIYMLACAQRRFASYKLLKKCTVIFVLVSPLCYFSDDVFEDYFPALMPYATLVAFLVVVIGLLILSPFSFKYLFSSEWIEQIHNDDMTFIIEKVEQTDRFGKYNLTPRQKEIAILLLAAKTRRQIAGELGVSESTVKNHTSELYKKLGINSRIELFRIFGIDEEKSE
jgi:DNA-binding CsgD family transcriptional regulator